MRVDSKIERALVVGATGFVGRHIVRALAARDIEVVGLRRWNSDPGRVAALDVPTVVGDLLDPAQLLEVMPGFNYVVMAAAPELSLNDSEYMKASAMGMRNLLAICREVRVEKVVVTSCATTIAHVSAPEIASADAVYLPGSAPGGLDQNPAGGVSGRKLSLRDRLLGKKPPVASAWRRVDAQYAAELECFRQAADGLDLTILCPGVCIGDESVLPARELLAGVSESARINVVDVEAVARAHVHALLDDDGELLDGELFTTRRYALGGENTTIGELYQRLEPSGSGERRLGDCTILLSDDPVEVRALDLFGADLWLDSSSVEEAWGFNGMIGL